MSDQKNNNSLGLRAGDWVMVRSRAEILATLDKNGALDKMPFMPEMLQFAGQKLQVSKRAHKTCDPINGLESRALPDSVHIGDLRCDGSAHADCQAGCLFFFKEAWLKRADDTSNTPVSGGGCTEDDLQRATIDQDIPPDKDGPTYVCQATRVNAATTSLPWYRASQYVEDLSSGNTTVLRMFNAWVFWVWHNIAGAGFGVGSAMRFSYDQWQKLIGGSPYPWRTGKIPQGKSTPALQLDIKEGEYVRTKSYREILDTLDGEWKNRGLYFDAEMVPYTEKTLRVLKRVSRLIHEKTGKMLVFKSPCMILEGSVCEAKFAKCRKLCPRGYYLYWRDIWVNKIS